MRLESLKWGCSYLAPCEFPPPNNGRIISFYIKQPGLTTYIQHTSSSRLSSFSGSSLSHYSKMESDDSLPDVSEESNYTQPKSGRKRPSPTSKETQKAITATVGKEFLTEEQKREKSKKTSGTTCSKIFEIISFLHALSFLK